MLCKHLLSSSNGFLVDMTITKSNSTSVVLSELIKVFSCLHTFCACNHHRLIFFNREQEWLCAFIFHTSASVLHKFSVQASSSQNLECCLSSSKVRGTRCDVRVPLQTASSKQFWKQKCSYHYCRKLWKRSHSWL
jgi:hypothetical protein